MCELTKEDIKNNNEQFRSALSEQKLVWKPRRRNGWTWITSEDMSSALTRGRRDLKQKADLTGFALMKAQ